MPLCARCRAEAETTTRGPESGWAAAAADRLRRRWGSDTATQPDACDECDRCEGGDA